VTDHRTDEPNGSLSEIGQVAPVLAHDALDLALELPAQMVDELSGAPTGPSPHLLDDVVRLCACLAAGTAEVAQCVLQVRSGHLR
jgi:hypothetical protein